MWRTGVGGRRGLERKSTVTDMPNKKRPFLVCFFLPHFVCSFVPSLHPSVYSVSVPLFFISSPSFSEYLRFVVSGVRLICDAAGSLSGPAHVAQSQSINQSNTTIVDMEFRAGVCKILDNGTKSMKFGSIPHNRKRRADG